MSRVLPSFVLVLVVASLRASAALAVLPDPPPLPTPGQVVGVVTSIVTPSTPPAASTAQPSSQAAAHRTVAVSRASDLEAGILLSINTVRRRYGLRPLAQSAALTRAAVAHVDLLATDGYFSHDWSNGTPFRRWIRTFYPVGRASFWSTGENLLWGTTTVTPAEAVAAWLASPEHRRNLLDSKWRQIGLGIVRVAAAPGFYKGQDVAIAATEFGVRR